MRSRARQADRRRVTTTDQGKRSADYEKAQQLIHDEALWIPLAYPTTSAIMQANVTGYTVSPFGRQNFGNVVLN